MKMRTLVRQTLFLSASHFLNRVVGFVMRIWLSRELGAQAMGLVELAQSAQMLLIAPVVSGLPAAMSRMCAKANSEDRMTVLHSGILLSLWIGLPVAALGWMLKTPLALWLGDIRTLPALMLWLPCIPILGVSCALNGYYYGAGKPLPPALSEMLEQAVRFALTLQLLRMLRGFPLMLRSAIPAAATLAGETAALLLMLIPAGRMLLQHPVRHGRRRIIRELITLALPLTGMRLVASLMRTVQSVLIPARLQASGLSAAEAVGRLGMLNGMAMPVLMLPSFITCSLSMVAAPEITRRQARQLPQKKLICRILAATLAIGLAAMAAVFCMAPVLAGVLYRQAELLPLLRRSCPLIPVMSLCQVAGALMNGLGLQSASLKISIASNLLGTLLMYLLAIRPEMRLWGVIIAIGTAQAATLCLSLRTLLHAAQ